jgi:hypothetical protein
MDLLSKVGLMAIIQLVIVLLWSFFVKIKAYGRAVVAQLGGTMGISAFSSGLQPGYWGTPHRTMAI